MNTKQDAGGRVLVVCLPAADSDLHKLRDYIAESLAMGVLALPEGSECTVLDLPPLNGIRVEAPAGEAAKESPEQPAASVPHGRGAAEKQEILARMKAYRQAHGLGCWAEMAKYTRGVSAEILRDMAAGQATQPIAVWRKAGQALDKLEARPHAE